MRDLQPSRFLNISPYPLILFSFNVATDYITAADGLRGGTTVFDASLTLLLDFKPYENDPYIRTLMREACHRGLYALINSAAMNGVGPNTEISQIIFWPVTLSFVLAIIFWVLNIVMAVLWGIGKGKWKKSEAYLNYKTMKATLKAEKKAK